jgi:hypothetical protein
MRNYVASSVISTQLCRRSLSQVENKDTDKIFIFFLSFFLFNFFFAKICSDHPGRLFSHRGWSSTRKLLAPCSFDLISHKVLSICLSVFMSFCLLCPSVFLSFCLPALLYFCPSAFLSFCLSVILLFCYSVFFSFCLSTFMSFCRSVFLSFLHCRPIIFAPLFEDRDRNVSEKIITFCLTSIFLKEFSRWKL